MLRFRQTNGARLSRYSAMTMTSDPWEQREKNETTAVVVLFFIPFVAVFFCDS